MFVSAVRAGRLACTAALLLLAAHVQLQCVCAAPIQRDSKFRLPTSPANATWASAEGESLAATVGSPVSGFVKAQGTNFVVNGKITFFAGSNNFFLGLRAYVSDAQVREFFQVMSANGVDVVRFWAFCNGLTDPYIKGLSIQPELGVYDEAGLQRLDLILAEAAKNGVRVIFPLVNVWPDLGGMQWWVDQVLGPGHPMEAFYQDGKVIEAFKTYVKMILTRKNTITGVVYSEDPVVLAVELANEPHTSDGYERALGQQPGSLVKSWACAMASYIKSIDHHHMVATGEEGYQAFGAQGAWMDDGTKGLDFTGNLACAAVDFATVHLYPGSWGVAAASAGDFAMQYLNSRAAVARAANKPWVLEEVGMESTYTQSRNAFLTSMFAAAKASDAAAVLVWEIMPWHVANQSYDFSWDDSGSEAMRSLVAYQLGRTSTCSGGSCPAVPPPCLCFDIPPGNSNFTCGQEVAWHSGCSASYLSAGTCDISCKRCTPCAGYDYCHNCRDAPPGGSAYTCAQQLSFHPDVCSQPFMAPSTCDATCGRCKPCDGVQPSDFLPPVKAAPTELPPTGLPASAAPVAANPSPVPPALAGALGLQAGSSIARTASASAMAPARP